MVVKLELPKSGKHSQSHNLNVKCFKTNTSMCLCRQTLHIGKSSSGISIRAVANYWENSDFVGLLFLPHYPFFVLSSPSEKGAN